MKYRSLRIRPALAAVIIASAGAIGAAGAALAQPADLVFVNGQVFTAARRSRQRRKALPSRTADSSPSAHRTRAHACGPGTMVVDLARPLCHAGPCRRHFHNEGGGRGIDLSATRSIADVLAVVGAAAKAAQARRR